MKKESRIQQRIISCAKHTFCEICPLFIQIQTLYFCSTPGNEPFKRKTVKSYLVTRQKVKSNQPVIAFKPISFYLFSKATHCRIGLSWSPGISESVLAHFPTFSLHNSIPQALFSITPSEPQIILHIYHC